MYVHITARMGGMQCHAWLGVEREGKRVYIIWLFLGLYLIEVLLVLLLEILGVQER